MEENIYKNILTPVKGDTVPLKDIDDETFSSGIMGAGIGIIPSEGKYMLLEMALLALVLKQDMLLE